MLFGDNLTEKNIDKLKKLLGKKTQLSDQSLSTVDKSTTSSIPASTASTSQIDITNQSISANSASAPVLRLDPQPMEEENNEDIPFHDDSSSFDEGTDLERDSDEEECFGESSNDNDSFDEDFLFNIRELCSRQGGTRNIEQEEQFLTSSTVQSNLKKLASLTEKIADTQTKYKRSTKEITDKLKQDINDCKQVCISREEFDAAIQSLSTKIDALTSSILSLGGTVARVDTPPENNDNHRESIRRTRRSLRRSGRVTLNNN